MKKIYNITDTELLENANLVLKNFTEDLELFTNLHDEKDKYLLGKLEISVNKLNETSFDNKAISDELIFELNTIHNLLSEIKNIAKYIFPDNPEKLQRYINMNKNTPLPGKPNKLEYFHSSEEFKWEPSEHSTLYQLQYAFEPNMENPTWEEAAMTPVSNIHFVPEKAGEYIFRVIGFNEAGFGEPSDVLDMYFGRY